MTSHVQYVISQNYHAGEINNLFFEKVNHDQG